jgi:uncharacterized membrane protein
MQASILIPIISVLCLFLKTAFGIEINEELQSSIADAVVAGSLAIIGILGVIKAHNSKKLTNLK